MNTTIHSTMSDGETLASESLNIGDKVDRYEIEAWIGQGGCASVYQVRHQQLNVSRALKVLHTTSTQTQQRFVMEGRLQAQWHHPNIVRVHDALIVNGKSALILDFVNGLTLSQHIKVKTPNFNALLDLFVDVVKGVQHAHQHDIIHRDLKPSNIMVAFEQGRFIAKVTDFGIAKHLHPMIGEHPQTKTDALLGTPNYMAPEQIRHHHPISVQTDVFSLGTILYEMCCGKRPFDDADTLELLNRIATVRYISPQKLQPNTPDVLIKIIDGCLQQDPKDRFKDCASILDLLGPDPVTIEPIIHKSSASSSTPPVVKTRHSFALITCCVVLLAIASVFAWLHFNARAQPTKTIIKTVSSPPDMRTPHALETRALRIRDNHPAQALALLRASASLDGSTTHSLRDPAMRFDLINRGASSHVVPLDHQALVIKLSQSGKILGVVGEKRVWFIDTQTGVSTSAKMPFGYNSGELYFMRDDKIAYLMPRTEPVKEAPSVLALDVRSGEFLHTINHLGVVYVHFQPHNKALLTTSLKKIVKWDENGAPASVRKFENHVNVTCPGWMGGDKQVILATRSTSPNKVQSNLLLFDGTTLKLNSSVPFDHKIDYHPCIMILDESNDQLYFANNHILGLYQLSTGKKIAQRNDINSVKLRVRWHKKRNLLIVGSERLPYQILNGRTLKSITSLKGHDGPIRELDINLKHDVALSASSDRNVGLWSLDGQLITKFKGHRDWVLSMTRYNPKTPSSFWTGGRDNTVRRWSISSMSESASLPELPDDILHYAWSHDGKKMAIVARSGQYIWRANATPSLYKIPGTGFVKSYIWDDSAIFSRNDRFTHVDLTSLNKLSTKTWASPDVKPHIDEDYILSVVSSEHILYQTRLPGAKTHKLPLSCWPRGFGRIFKTDKAFVWCMTGKLYQLDMKQHTLKVLNPLPRTSTRYFSENTVTKTLLFGSWYGETTVWDMKSQTFTKGFKQPDAIALNLSAKTKPWFIVGSPRGHLNMLDAKSGKLIASLPTLPDQPIKALLTPDDHYLTVLTRSGSIYRFDLVTKQIQDVFKAPNKIVDIRYNDSGQLIGFDRKQFWRLPELKPSAKLLSRTGSWTNLRVCAKSMKVVPVIPFPKPETVWAPESLCAVSEQ